MEDAIRVSSPSYWLDACEDIPCDDFIDFHVSDPNQQQHQQQSIHNNNQDFFGGIDRILDSIKNGAGLPPTPPPPPLSDDDANLSNVKNQGNNNADGGALVDFVDQDEERFSKRVRVNGYNNERRINHQTNSNGSKERFERCFNGRKRPRAQDFKKRDNSSSVRRDVRGYWERDKSSGSNDLVFRSGTWEPDRVRQDKMIVDVKQETSDDKNTEQVSKEKVVPEEKARQYQLDVLEQAKSRNTIAFLETGAGKTLIAVLLIKSIHETLNQQNKKMLAVFLVPKVPLVYQQAEVIRERTGYQVGHYCGEMGQDFWDARRWQREFDTKHVLVMTAQILLNILRHSIIKMEGIDLLILDECHHAVKKHPYSLVMSEFYHTTSKEKRPSVFGMTASPVNLKGVLDNIGIEPQVERIGKYKSA